MTPGKRFEDLLVWQKAMDLVIGVYQECRRGPMANDWGLRNQLQRAVVSIVANIAEGYERGSRKEYVQFLTIAKGSAGESRCLLFVAERLGYLPKKESSLMLAVVTEVSRMLKGLINSLKV